LSRSLSPPAKGPLPPALGGGGGGAAGAPVHAAASALRIQVRPDQPFDVKPGEQVLHLFIWECTRPFADSPALKLQFSYEDAAQQLSLRIPLLIGHFVQPRGADFDAAAFTTSWTQFASSEVMATLKAPGVMSVAALSEGLATALRMAAVKDVDSSPLNLYGAGTFHTCTRGKDGNPVTMLVLVRFETKAGLNAFRVTVHSGHKSVSESVLSAISVIWQAPPLNAKKPASA